MGVYLVSRVEACADNEDDNLANVIGQGGVGGHRQGQIPNGLADAGLVQPRIPWAHQGTIVSHGLEGIKVAGNAFAHLVIKRLLFWREVGRRDKRQAHELSSSWTRAARRHCRRKERNYSLMKASKTGPIARAAGEQRSSADIRPAERSVGKQNR